MRIAWTLCLSAALLLPACGDDAGPKKPEDVMREYLEKGGDPATFPGGHPGGLPGNVPGLNPEGRQTPFELTDEMMEQYVKLNQELAGMGDAPPTAAWLAARKWDWARWSMITGMLARSQAAVATDGMAARYEKLIAQHTEQIKTAEGGQKEMLETMLANERSALESLKQAPETTDVDRRNNEILQRWLPKIREADDSR